MPIKCATMHVEALSDTIQRNIEFVISHNLLNDGMLKRYERNNVHRVLQYCLMKINGIDLIALPEYKVELRKPINKLEIDKRFEGRKKRRQTFVKVDVAYLKDSELVGIGEVYTPDEIHGVLETKALKEPWITPRHKIEHLMYNRLRFLVIVNMVNKLPNWKDAKRYKLEEWEGLWKEFVREIHEKQGIECLHIIIRSVSSIEYVPLR